jgi:uncharacterized membrane protein
MTDKPRKTRDIIILSIFTILSALGGLVKIGTPVGSIALDYFSPLTGSMVGALGHLASAATGGFPLTWMHIPIAIMQGIWSFTFGFLIRKINRSWALIISGIVAVVLNGVIAPLLLIPLQPSMKGLFISLIPLLSLASFANIVVAAVSVFILSKTRSAKL